MENPRIERPVYDDLGPNAPSFEDYFNDHISYIKEVQEEMSHPLEDAPAIMDRQARDAEGHHARIKSILSWADSFLDVAEHVKLKEIGPRSSDFTDLDRDKALAAAVTRERRFRDVIKGLVESIETRISYSQTRLRAFSQAEGQRFQA